MPQPPNSPAAIEVLELGKYLSTLLFKKQLPSCPPSKEAVKFVEYITPLHCGSFDVSSFHWTHSAMQDFKVYSVVVLRSLTVPLPYPDFPPLGQSTAHSNVNIDPSDPVSVVKFCPGHGFAATPIVPDITGAEDVVDAVVVIEEDAVALVEDRRCEEAVEVVSRSGFDSVLL